MIVFVKKKHRDDDRHARQVALDDVRPALRLRREPHAAEPGVASRMHQDEADETGGEQDVDDSEKGQHRGGSVASGAGSFRARSDGGVEDRADEIAGDLVLRDVRGRPGERARETSCGAAEPVSTITRVPGTASWIAWAASIPSITGISMSISTTSGRCSRASRPLLVRRPPARSPRFVASVERIASRASAKSR